MRQSRLILNLMMLVVLVMAQVSFAEKEGKEGSGKLGGWYSYYAKELGMNEEQVAKYKEIIEKKQAAESKWKEENKDKFEAAEQAYKAAKESGDKDAIEKAKTTLYAMRDERDKASKDYEESLDALLTPEQKGKKAALGLANSMNWTLKKANLTEEQKAKIKELAIAESDKYAALEGSDHKALGKAKQDFKQKVIDEVLTEEQKAALGDDAKSKAKPEKEAKEKKEKSEKAEKADKSEKTEKSEKTDKSKKEKKE